VPPCSARGVYAGRCEMEQREGEVAEIRHTSLPGPFPGNSRGNGWRGARGRGATFPAHSGCAGAPPGPTTGACQELADGGGRAKPVACEGAVDPKGAASSQSRRWSEASVGKARPGTAVKTPQMSPDANVRVARRRAPRTARCVHEGSGCAFSARRPLVCGGKETDDGLPGPQGTGAMTHAYDSGLILRSPPKL
jgi:hypothetical protein